MAKGFYIGVNNVARKVVKGYVGVENVARRITEGYVGVDNVARKTFTTPQIIYDLDSSVLKDNLRNFRDSYVSAEYLTVVFRDGTEVNTYLFEACYTVYEYTTDEDEEISEYLVWFDIYEDGTENYYYKEQYYDIDNDSYVHDYRESNPVDKIILTRPIDEYAEDFIEFLNVIGELVEPTV